MNSKKLYHWVGDISKTWTDLNQHFCKAVQVFSEGVVRSSSSQIRKIAGASQGRGLQRFLSKAQPLPRFFVQWTRSVVKAVKLGCVVLVVDETKLKDQFGVMVVGSVYHGRCIPLAWRVYRANSTTDYPAEGQVGMILTLLAYIDAGLPAGTGVRVLADRGIGTSPQLMRGIIDLGWLCSSSADGSKAMCACCGLSRLKQRGRWSPMTRI